MVVDHTRCVLSALVDLALPRSCVGCHAPDGAGLCPRCRPITPPLVSTAAGFPLAAAASYDGPVRAALLAYKERGRRDLARALGGLLADAVRALEPGTDAALVPVPSSRRARRERGGDHVARLARVVARTTGLTVSRPLVLRRAVRDSAGLDTEARAANLGGAIRARRPGRYLRAIVLDDIATTGATLIEATRALTEAGWYVGGAAVVAATVKRTGADRWRDPATGSSVGMT